MPAIEALNLYRVNSVDDLKRGTQISSKALEHLRGNIIFNYKRMPNHLLIQLQEESQSLY